MTVGDQRKSVATRFRNEVAHALAVDVTKRVVYLIGVSSCGGLGLLIWRGGSVPAWTLALACLAVVALALTLRMRAFRYLAALEWHETYSGHVARALDALQRIVAGDIDIPIPHYIEAGILEPARDLITDKPAEHVRFSILLPRDDGARWWMPWSAGHSITGKAKYDQRIVDTLSRHAYESGHAQHWPDVGVDSAFRQNPMASHETSALLSLPLRWGDQTLGVFNVVSSESHAFDPAEETYITSLGAVISVAVGIHLKDQLHHAGSE
ncbi:MAG TPA: GAF domain-containing protein [Conexibacter sp.]|nr:GAF domain-containing protein [Conexibacter sp.]